MLKNIAYSKHSLVKIHIKIHIINSHGFYISREMIEQAMRQPDTIEKGHKGRFIAQCVYDDNHVLRVVYEEHVDKLYVITVYPGRRKRYDKNTI